MLLADANISNGPGNLPRDKRSPSPRALMVEEDTVTCKHTVCLTVVDRDPISI